MPSGRRLVKDPERYKTVMCATWSNTGECPYGRKCQFAHGREELRVRTAPPLSSMQPQQPPMPQRQQQAPPATLNGMRAPLPHAPMALWPSAQQSHLPGLSMPPLPPGPPPNNNNFHLERGLLLNPQMGGAAPAPGVAPPLPRGPLAAGPAEYQNALCQPCLATGGTSAGIGGLPAQQPAQALSLGAGQMDRSPVLLPPPPSAMAPSAEPPLPSALLPGAAPLPAPSVLASLPAAMAPSMAPPLPAAPAEQVLGAQAMEPSMAPAAMAPSAEPPLLPAVAGAPTAEPPLPTGTGAAALPTSIDVSDELACFAMKCAVAEKELRDQTNCFHPSELWSPLKFNDQTGKLEANQRAWPADGGLENEKLDSPLEPGMGKREVSFSTQMVRRAVSFIFNDAIEEECESPLKSEARQRAQSPHTAIAA